MFDDPKDEMTKGPHGEPEGDEFDIEGIMGQPLEGDDTEDPLKGDPLEEALASAGFKVSPEVLDQIKALVSKPSAKPPLGGKEAPGAAGEPPMGGKPPMGGGAVPSGMKGADFMR